MTHPKVLELWEMLEAKKGNTASQLACLDNWLENTKGWAFYNEDFGETFKFFKSNSSTCNEAARKFSEKLGQIYCEVRMSVVANHIQRLKMFSHIASFVLFFFFFTSSGLTFISNCFFYFFFFVCVCVCRSILRQLVSGSITNLRCFL